LNLLRCMGGRLISFS